MKKTLRSKKIDLTPSSVEIYLSQVVTRLKYWYKQRHLRKKLNNNARI